MRSRYPIDTKKSRSPNSLSAMLMGLPLAQASSKSSLFFEILIISRDTFTCKWHVNHQEAVTPLAEKKCVKNVFYLKHSYDTTGIL